MNTQTITEKTIQATRQWFADNQEACIEEAGYKYNQIAEILKRSENTYTLKVQCELEVDTI